MFTRGPLLGVRLFFLVILSIALMIWDYHKQPTVAELRAELSTLTTPLVYAAHSPFAFFDAMAKNFESRQELLQQNTTLRAQLLILQGEMQKLQALQIENQELRALLQSSSMVSSAHLAVAQIMALQASPFRQEILLNKGSHAGAFVGQAVLDAHGIMGQVIEVSPYTARVLLLTDPRSSVPVQNNRTGLHGILNGQGTAVLSWADVPPTVDIKPGDALTTSGLGGRYPVGYPVGIVSNVNRHTNDQFLQITVMPSAQMHSDEQVLLVWPEKTKIREKK